MAEITFQQEGGFGQAAVWKSECYPWPPLTQVSEQQVFHRPWQGLFKLDKSTTDQCSTDREKSLDINKGKDKTAETLIGNAFHCISSLQKSKGKS